MNIERKRNRLVSRQSGETRPMEGRAIYSPVRLQLSTMSNTHKAGNPIDGAFGATFCNTAIIIIR